ncbi:MAG: sulfurtransferase TusA family protein [Pseudomonadota bacterium]|nr:sulfurtransferase TusA family protein [Pseudomonadota bacterium]
MSDPSQELKTVDARGLLCPLPVIRTQERVKQLAPGTILKVLATDPGSLEDIPAWCRVHGHTVLDIRREHDNILLIIRV